MQDAAVIEAVAPRLRDYVVLVKPRISMLAAIVALAGNYMASASASMVNMINTVLGTFLLSAGACALNQYMERDLDALMVRTRNRPLPAGNIQPASAFIAGVVLSFLGVGYLALGCNITAGAVGAFALVTYLYGYTPLKRHTALCTLVGAIPGALPPVIGWACANGSLGYGAFLMFGIMFVWQLPHFAAIAWIYRDDYKSAGMPMLTVVGPDGAFAARQMMLYAFTLLLISTLPAFTGMAGRVYFVVAAVTGAAYLWLCARWVSHKDSPRARQVFIASLVHITFLFTFIALDKQMV